MSFSLLFSSPPSGLVRAYPYAAVLLDECSEKEKIRMKNLAKRRFYYFPVVTICGTFALGTVVSNWNQQVLTSKWVVGKALVFLSLPIWTVIALNRVANMYELGEFQEIAKGDSVASRKMKLIMNKEESNFAETEAILKKMVSDLTNYVPKKENKFIEQRVADFIQKEASYRAFAFKKIDPAITGL